MAFLLLVTDSMAATTTTIGAAAAPPHSYREELIVGSSGWLAERPAFILLRVAKEGTKSTAFRIEIPDDIKSGVF